jgi:hypothetical protein
LLVSNPIATNEILTQIVGILFFLHLLTIHKLNNNIVLQSRCIQFIIFHMKISRANINLPHNKSRFNLVHSLKPKCIMRESSFATRSFFFPLMLEQILHLTISIFLVKPNNWFRSWKPRSPTILENFVYLPFTILCLLQFIRSSSKVRFIKIGWFMDVFLEIITLFPFKVALKDIRDTCETDTNDKGVWEVCRCYIFIKVWDYCC